jgi:putative ABC transport system permease protein
LAIGVGLAVAVLIGRSLQAALFEVSPGDPRWLATAAVLVVIVVLAASLIPARRAARVDPVTVLRAP